MTRPSRTARAALASDVRDASLDAWDIYNERGYAEFLAARYDAAAADFDKALALGASSRADDVLWLPYQLAWLHIAHARAGRNDAEAARRACRQGQPDSSGRER